MNHAIKIEDFEHLTVEKANQVSELLREFGYDLLGVDRVHELECRRRDGFIPWSHNKGGWGNHGYTSIDYIIGSGYYTGSDKANELIDRIHKEECEDALKNFKEQNQLPEDLDFCDFDEEQTYEYEEYESEWFMNADGYLDICVEYQGRYLGYERGIHTISLNVFINVTDAPYFRGSDDGLEVVISFRDIDSKSFNDKLERAKKELEEFIGNVDLY